MYEVIIKTDIDGNITAIDSSAFVSGEEWIKIDEGEGSKYAYAQNNYLKKPIMDEYGRYNYRYVGGKVEEIPAEDKPTVPVPVPVPTNEELAAAVTELAEIIMGGMM